MKCKAVVTFEFLTRPPVTLRLPELSATGPQTIASRALNQAKKELKPIGWCSLVVALERLDAGESKNA